MFDKFLGKFKKSHFDLPDKNFVYDSRTVSKLSSKDLILLTTDQDKYITTLLKKVTKEEFSSTGLRRITTARLRRSRS